MNALRKYSQFYGMIFFVLLVLNGCADFGNVNADTTRKAIVIANAEVRAANLLLQDLVKRDALTDIQALRALDHLQTAKDHLQMAANAINIAGDPLSGQTNLERANSALGLAIALLAPLVENDT